MIQRQTPSGFAWRADPAQRTRQAQASPTIAPPTRKPFSKPITNAHAAVVLPFKTAKSSPYSTGLKPGALDKLPPLDEKWILSRPEPSMGDAACELFRLKSWLHTCLNDRRFDSEVFVTECRLREQAAFIIGYFA
ncbi:MAG: hypothetical protein Q7K57_40215 [Burkholderiaceae bacterium]|nr:hypothetical protein [Burkholderiaceae bacterium]